MFRARLLGLVLVVAGCSPAASAVPTAAPPTTGSTAAVAAAELCAIKPGTPCQFYAGNFKSTRFTGGVTFTLVGDNPWTNIANEPDVIVLTIGGSGGFGDTGDPNVFVFVHGAPRLGSGAAAAAVADPEQAKAILGGIAGLTVKPVGGAVIDGRGGVVFRVSNTGTAKVVLWQYPTTTGAGSFDLPAGATAEVHWLTIDGVPVIVGILAPGDGLDSLLLDGDPILKSIHFG